MVSALMTHDPEKRPDINSVTGPPRMQQAEPEGAMFSSPKGDGSNSSRELQKHLRMTFGMLVEKVRDEHIVELRRPFKHLDRNSSGIVGGPGL